MNCVHCRRKSNHFTPNTRCSTKTGENGGICTFYQPKTCFGLTTNKTCAFYQHTKIEGVVTNTPTQNHHVCMPLNLLNGTHFMLSKCLLHKARGNLVEKWDSFGKMQEWFRTKMGLDLFNHQNIARGELLICLIKSSHPKVIRLKYVDWLEC